MQAILAALIPYVLPLVGSALGLAATAALAKFKSWLETKIKNETARGILSRLSDAAAHAVGEVWQVSVEAVKKSGKLDADTAKAAKDAAIASIKNHLGPNGLKELQDILGVKCEADLTPVLESHVESAVADFKSNMGFVVGNSR